MSFTMENPFKILLLIRAATILALIILGNTIIIIDEPSVHLNSNLLAKYLVKLVKRVKKIDN